MKRAADRVSIQLAEIQRFLNHAFAGEGRIAVNQDHHAPLAVRIALTILFGPQAAQSDGIYKFQMAGIETQRKMDRPARGRYPIGAVSQVIFDVAASADIKTRVHIGKRPEDLTGAFRHDVGEGVQAATMRHAENNLVDPLLA